MSNPITTYYQDIGRYPANNQTWHIAINSGGNFSPNLLQDASFGSSPSAKGHFILDVFTPRRWSLSGQYPHISERDEVEVVRPTTNTFFAGRFWTSGLSSKRLAGRIYYSQLLEDLDRVGKCYSENDPTAGEFNDPLDTDGGVIKIPESGDIQKLEAIGNGVAVIADNGIWFIRGGDQKGFTPTAHSISKISNFGSTSPSTIVGVGSNVYYWGKEAIYVMGYTELDGLTVTDTTATTIAGLFSDIPRLSKTYSRGLHNANDKKIHWFYKSVAPVSDADRFVYDSVLNLDLQLGAFTTYSIKTLETDSPILVGAMERSSLAARTRVDGVTIGADTVVIGADTVITNTLFTASVSINVKGIAMVPTEGGFKYTFADFSNEEFLDWKTMDDTGLDAFAFAIPAYETFQEPSREKRATYVTTHFNRTETGFNAQLEALNPSGCFMQAKWDWDDSGTITRGARQQVYRLPRIYTPSSPSDTFDYGVSVITSRTKIRGAGHALTLNFESEAGKDFQLLGWTTNVSIRA